MNELHGILALVLLIHFSSLTNGFGRNVGLYFKPLQYEPRIYQRAGPGVHVVTLDAYFEPNIGGYTGVVYVLEANYDHQYFAIEKYSGDLTTNWQIDREIGQSYNITIKAIGVSPYENVETTKQLSIIVSAYNRFGPKFLQTNYTNCIHNLSPIGSTILDVKAIDEDIETYNSHIYYTIIPNPILSLPFVLNATSGQLITNDTLNDKQEFSYEFEIRATDTGSPLGYNTTKVYITTYEQLSAPTIKSIGLNNSKTQICWQMNDLQQINGYIISYKVVDEISGYKINLTNYDNKNNSPQCYYLSEIKQNSVYTIEISAWIGQEVGPSSQQFYKYTIDSTCKCGPNPECKVSDGVCVCPHGILGRYSCTQSTPCPLDCQNEGNCIYADNGKPRCVCKHGFQGQTCDMKIKCNSEKTFTKKGRIVWHEIGFNEKILHPCPYGSINNMSASRICLLQPNGTAFWSTVDDNHCLEKIKMTTTTEPPMSTTSISVIDLLSRDIVRTVATDTIRSTQLLVAVDDFLTNDRETQELNENINLKTIITNILSETPINDSKVFITSHKSFATKSVNISFSDANNEISFKPEFKINMNESQSQRQNAVINLPIETLEKALMQSNSTTVRVQFIAYKNHKLFKTRENNLNDIISRKEMPVIEATVGNVVIDRLRKPVAIVLSCNECNESDFLTAKCVFWDELHQNWSTKGIQTEPNAKNKSITCLSSHLTAFSVLFDLTPYETREEDIVLSIVTSIGCYLSVCGLILTLITYTLFRCLNRDNSGKILLNLCLSLLLLNVSFLIGSQKIIFESNNWCAFMAFAIHYFVLTSLCWMFVEAVHIYQLLIYVFATSETRFMLKRTVFAWGLPFIWVMITAFVKPIAYRNNNDFCMISPKYSDVYYISYLMPASILIVLNSSAFVMAIRVLFTPRLESTASIKSGKVSMSQVLGALTLMALLGVSWIFGALAIGEMKLFFQYLFCVTNSLQGFLIFVFRVIRFPEARNAWIQFFTSGTLKKYRGQRQRLHGSNGTNRMSASDKKPIDTESSFSMAYNSESKTSKPFLSPDESDVKHFTTYDSIRVSNDKPIDT